MSARETLQASVLNVDNKDTIMTSVAPSIF